MMAEQIYVSPNRCESEQELNDFIDNIDKDFCQNKMIETEKEVEDFLDDFPNETEWRESFNIALKESTSNNFALLFKSENRSFLFIGQAEECGGTLPIDDFESITHYFDISKAGITENGNFFITGLPFEETHHKKQHETFEIKSLSDKAYERFLKDFVDDGRLLVEKDFVLYSIPNDYARKLYDDDKATIQLKVENIANVLNIRKNR